MAATSVKPAARPRVLVVEDDHAICVLISGVLDDIGLDTVCVRSDRAAYDQLPTLPPFSAILVDVNLGAGTTGFDVARFARQVIPQLPVIYVTGEASLDSFRAFGVPDSDFVAKPFTAEGLARVVRTRIPAND
jgi:CheY-like chemotaxis protein